MRRVLSIVVILLCLGHVRAQVTSYFESGEWIKLSLTESGVYKVTYEQLEEAADLGSVASSDLMLFGFSGNGTIPQLLTNGEEGRIQEAAIQLFDGGDDSFGPGDSFLFYGRAPHFLEFDSTDLRFSFQRNIYTDTAYYFLRIGESATARIESSQVMEEGALLTTAYQSVTHEIDQFNLLNSGRSWYGERLNNTQSTIQFDVGEGMLEGTLSASVMASSLSPSTFLFEGIGEIEVRDRIVDDYTKAYKETVHFDLDDSFSGEINISYSTGDNSGFGFIDQWVLSAVQMVELGNHQEHFCIPAETDAGPAVFEIQNFQPNQKLWDITNHLSPAEVQVSGTGQYGFDHSQMKNYVLFDVQQALMPSVSSVTNNTHLRSGLNVELLILTDRRFVDQAEALAEHRSAYSGFSCAVVPVEEIYNEYGSGMPDITAIRNFIYQVYTQGALKHVLLFGDASFDYKDRVTPNTNFVPTYESRNSLIETFSHASDDYYGFMEPGEGDWLENVSTDHSMDIGVGRLPVKDEAEAERIVQKIIRYDQDETFGLWRMSGQYSADDGDDNTHQEDADIVVSDIEVNSLVHRPSRLFIDQYPQGFGDDFVAKKVLNQKINEGQLIYSYLGHGNEYQLAEELLLVDFEVANWTNAQLPFFVTQTCDFGVFDDPNIYSGGEKYLLGTDYGAIGLVTATRKVQANVNFDMNRTFANEVFIRGENGYRTLGEVFAVVKNENLLGRKNRNQSLLADPSMTLKIPEWEIRIDSTVSGTDEMTQGLRTNELNRLYGSVLTNDGSTAEGFYGEVSLWIYDSPSAQRTIGQQNDPFEYDSYESILFKGKASVVAGHFEIEMILPEAVGESTEYKVQAYAFDIEMGVDASGGQFLPEGEPGNLGLQDDRAPSIRMYLNDTGFHPGEAVLTNSILLVELDDDTGIDLRVMDGAPALYGVLDGGTPISLNEYYSAKIDDYSAGWVELPLFDLAKGQHEFTIYAQDFSGNTASKTIRFSVSEGDRTLIHNFKTYPVPSYQQDILFSFRTNREYSELSLTTHVYNMRGEVVNSTTQHIDYPGRVVEGTLWYQEDQIRVTASSGMYFYKVLIESTEPIQQVLSGKILIR